MTNNFLLSFTFNTQESVDEVAGLKNHTTALFWEYDTRLGIRWNKDPKFQESESPYAVNRGNPLYYNDVNGDNPIMGAILGAFTEYASIVGGKMLFEHQDFFEANSNLGWTDALDITIASGFGAASGAIDGGIVNFSKWIAKPTNQKIVAMMIEVGVSSLESSLKQIYKDEEFDLTSILAGALADAGVGNLLKTDIVKKEADIAKKNANASTKKAEDLAKRKNPNQKQIKKTKNEAVKHNNQAKALNNLNNTGVVIKDTGKKIVSNKTQDVFKKKKNTPPTKHK